MAIYRFKVSFEDYDDITREIDIKPGQTFEDLHRAIHQSTGYNPEQPSSFYISNDQWTKGEEITFMPNQKRIDRGIALMEKVKLSNRIDDPHQKFYYTFNFDRPYDFHVELMKIMMDENPNVTYPYIAKVTGEAPKLITNSFNPTVIPPTNEDFDFLNEMEYVAEDTEDFSEVTETGDDDDEQSHGISASDDEEEDDIMDEFADNEHIDDERNNHDDY